MSTKAIKLMSLLSENLLEYGDLKNIKPYEFDSKGELAYEFNSEDDSTVLVTFTKLNDLEIKHTKIPSIIDKKKISSYFNIGYKVDGSVTQGKKSSLSELLRIVKTITEIIDVFLSKNKNAALLVFEDNKDPGLGFSKGQKSMLYQAVINQNLPSGYTSREAYVMDIEGLVIAPK